MQAEIKRIHSPDIDDLSSYYPDEPDCFAFLLQVMIGPKDEDWEESFDIEVCTPKWFESKYAENEAIFGRHILIVFEYDLERIKQKISKYCASCSGENWQELANKLGRIGYWEFEDYKPA